MPCSEPALAHRSTLCMCNTFVMSRGTAVHVRCVAGILKLPHIHPYVNVNHGAHACVALAGDDGHKEQDGQCRS